MEFVYQMDLLLSHLLAHWFGYHFRSSHPHPQPQMYIWGLVQPLFSLLPYTQDQTGF